jgi:hypothetical protein
MMAATAASVEPAALDRLLTALGSEAPPAMVPPRFDLTHLLWYGGALIILGAMTLFATLAFAQLGGGALTLTALVYAVVFVLAGNHLWTRGLTTPGGLMIAIAVGMAPMAVFGVQDSFGLWGWAGDPGSYVDFYDWINGSWIYMELATIAAGIAALRFYRFPFIVAIIAFALWFMSMDLTPWVFGREAFSWDERKVVSMWFGLALIPIAWAVDLSARRGDFAFWLHLMAIVTFWGGMSLQESDSELNKALYCLINIVLVFLSIFLMRRVYSVFGALGVCFYLGHLANQVFKDSLLFPFALSAIGVLIMAAGLWLHRHRPALSRWMAQGLPAGLRRLRPAHARA